VEDVAITGIGVVSPFGTGLAPFLEGMLAGKVTIELVERRAGGGSTLRSVVPDFDPGDVLDAKVLAGTEVFAQFAVVAAEESVKAAGLERLHPRRTAIVHGTSMGGSSALLRAQHRLETSGPDAVDPKIMIQMWPNMAAAQIAIKWDLHGPQMTLCHACASSIDAIGLAARMVSRGEADVALAGGTEGGSKPNIAGLDDNFVPATMYAGTRYKMSSVTRDPLRASLPFDRDRSGIVGAEGSVMFVLERGEHARARGADVLAYIRGHGSLADGYHPSSPEPTGAWERQVMEDALLEANLNPDDIDAVVAHATGTPAGDTAEIRALNGLFTTQGRAIPAMSIKGTVGHTGAASGGMGVAIAVNAMQNGVLPATMGTQNLDPEIEFNVVLTEPIEIRPRAVQINAFGFGGQDASLVVSRS
jgi:3-oxoacyl-[acyl-carrier-protein] synthase II